jgi:hypothetical protein
VTDLVNYHISLSLPHITNRYAWKSFDKRAYIAEASNTYDHCTKDTIAAAASTTSGWVDVSSIQWMADNEKPTVLRVDTLEDGSHLLCSWCLERIVQMQD